MPSRARTSGSSSKTAGTRVTRSLWPAASMRRAASARASGSRSRPITRSPEWASSIASVWPARPRVASTRTAPSAEQAGASSSVTRSRRTGTCTGGLIGSVLLIVTASRTVRICLLRGAARGRPDVGRRRSGGAGSGGWAAGARWWGSGVVGRSGGCGAEWGADGPGGGCPPPAGAAWRRGRASGGDPRGRGAPHLLRCGASAEVRDRAAGKAAGARPGRATGKAARTGHARRPGAANAGSPGITTTSASPRSPSRRTSLPARPRRRPSWRRPRSRSGCRRRR